MRRTWIKLFVDQILRGTCFVELEPDERFVFFGFLLLGGDSPIEGTICVSEGVGYTDEQIAGLLKIGKELLIRSKRKCVKFEKIRVLAGNVIQIVNWKRYQSDYGRQRNYRVEYKKRLQREVTTRSYNAKLHTEGEGEGEEDKRSLLKESSASETHPPSSESIKILEIIGKWNKFADGHGISPVRGIQKGSSRERALKARLKDKDWDFEKILEAIHHQAFLTGDNDRGWLINFDWTLKPANVTKILEGAYVRSVRGDAARRGLDDPMTGSNRGKR